MYNWQRENWPSFTWDGNALLDPIARANFERGRYAAIMASIGIGEQQESELKAMSLDVIKTSEIEGEHLDPNAVRSSIARRLGIPEGGLRAADRQVEGVVDIMLDVTWKFAEPLTKERLFGWHGALFPMGRSGLHEIDVGMWRRDLDGPMQVVSGRPDRQIVHYEAPPAERLEAEMEEFIKWFNRAESTGNGILRAAIAHLWFVTIHPLDDGNGRTGRAVADLAIAQMERTGQRFYSMSSQIEKEKKTYYELLESTQNGGLDITEWIVWFADCYRRAILDAERVTKLTVEKAQFLTRPEVLRNMSPRQEKIVRKLLDGFEGNMTANRYGTIAKCSPDTATRDIKDLIAKGIMIQNEGGSKKTSFSLNREMFGQKPEAAAEAADAPRGPGMR